MSSMYVRVHAHNCGIYSEHFKINDNVMIFYNVDLLLEFYETHKVL
jgi:hypothetical protein